MAPERFQPVVDTALSSPEAAFHWLVGTLVAALSGAGTWLVRTTMTNKEQIALVKQAVETATVIAKERHDETQDMLREIRAAVRKD